LAFVGFDGIALVPVFDCIIGNGLYTSAVSVPGTSVSCPYVSCVALSRNCNGIDVYSSLGSDIVDVDVTFIVGIGIGTVPFDTASFFAVFLRLITFLFVLRRLKCAVDDVDVDVVVSSGATSYDFLFVVVVGAIILVLVPAAAAAI